MKYFHGTVQGSGSKSSNSGTMSSGLRVEAHSKQGSIVVQLSENSGVDHACIYITRNPRTGKGTERILFNGRIDSVEPDVVIKLPSRATRQVTMPDPEILQVPEESTFLHIAHQNAPDQQDENFDQPVKLPTGQEVATAVAGFFNLPVTMHPSTCTLLPPSHPDHAKQAFNETVDREVVTFIRERTTSTLPPVQRRVQTTAISSEQAARMLTDNYNRLRGTLDPTGDAIEEIDLDEWINDSKEPRGPRISFGKLRILPDPSD